MQDGTRWWGRFPMGSGHVGRWRIGPLTLFVQRLQGEWRLARLAVDVEVMPDAGLEALPPGLEVLRFGMDRAGAELVLRPALADRPMVSRPELLLEVPAGHERVLFVSERRFPRHAEAPRTNRRQEPSRRSHHSGPRPGTAADLPSWPLRRPQLPDGGRGRADEPPTLAGANPDIRPPARTARPGPWAGRTPRSRASSEAFNSPVDRAASRRTKRSKTARSPTARRVRTSRST